MTTARVMCGLMLCSVLMWKTIRGCWLSGATLRPGGPVGPPGSDRPHVRYIPFIPGSDWRLTEKFLVSSWGVPGVCLAMRPHPGGVVKSVPSTDAKFRTLYEENHTAMRDYCLRRLSTDDAADAASEIFTVAWRKLNTVPPGPEARLWLYGVARNVVAHQHRSRGRRRRLQERLGQVVGIDEPEPATEVVVVRRSQEREVVTAMERLKPEDRELLRLKMWEELSHGEIGAVFGITAHAVDMRVQRVTQKLGKLLSTKVKVRPHPIVEGGEL